jgi:riboflavin kinase / FMN adenylyltransferase
MQIIPITYPIQNPEELVKPAKQVIAIGDFDGVHLGHQEVVKRALHTAEQLHLPASIMTFHPHPREVLGQEKYGQLLTPIGRKMEVLEKLGVCKTYVITFNRELMRLTPEQFIKEMLLPLQVESVVVGFDFTFGFQGKGNPNKLTEMSHGKFAVEVVNPYEIDGVKVSSTFIREALGTGDIDQVTKLLGRRYSLRGIVVSGDRRGRTIGFPTANLEPDEAYVIPVNGVYAIKARVKDRVYDGVMNIGVKPTFKEGELKPSLEAHLFNFSEDIYGESVTVELAAYLRQEKKFASIDELVSQIHADAEASKAKLMQLS